MPKVKPALIKGPWVVGGPSIETNHNGEYQGPGWWVSRPHPREGKHSARIWIMSGNQVKIFRTERAAITACNTRNKYANHDSY